MPTLIRFSAIMLLMICGPFILWHTFGTLMFYQGDEYTQGDWLINTLHQHVRRGPAGSMIIHIADFMKTDPLTVTVILQLSLFSILWGALLIPAFTFLREPAYALLITSPAFVIIYWTAETGAGMRKELIGLTSLFLLLAIPVIPKKLQPPLAGFAIAVFLFGAIAHEVNVLMAPAFVAVFYVVLRPDPKSPLAIGGLLIFLGLTAAAALYAVIFARIDDYMTVCQPLLDRGVDEKYCDGAVFWLERDLEGAWVMMEKWATPGSIAGYIVACILAMIPVIYVVSLHAQKKLLFIALGVFLLPIFPIFIVAFDWGRWLSVYLTSYFIFLFALSMQNHIHIAKKPNLFVLFGVGFLNMFWAPALVIGIRLGGVAERILL